MIRGVFVALALTTVFETQAMENDDEGFFVQPQILTKHHLQDSLFKIIASLTEDPASHPHTLLLLETAHSLIGQIDHPDNVAHLPVIPGAIDYNDSKDDSD
ncbi:MAG: hypothetical protein K2Q34_02575 [Alphaproteobacteria bacterium]|nr:hypothetical protein [Alphaproteobacteria bacterium]